MTHRLVNVEKSLIEPLNGHGRLFWNHLLPYVSWVFIQFYVRKWLNLL